MGRIEIQGIVSTENGLPFVQFRSLDDTGEVLSRWQLSPAEAREMAQNTIEASMNAVYDAAVIAWAKETWPEDKEMGARMLMLIREFRADKWGLPDNPEDWRSK